MAPAVAAAADLRCCRSRRPQMLPHLIVTPGTGAHLHHKKPPQIVAARITGREE